MQAWIWLRPAEMYLVCSLVKYYTKLLSSQAVNCDLK